MQLIGVKTEKARMLKFRREVNDRKDMGKYTTKKKKKKRSNAICYDKEL